MRNKVIILFSLLSFCFTSQLFGQTVNARQLDEALSSGNVTLTSANGSNYISSVNGRLRNNTANEILINIFINNGVYFSNSGVGQNMLAVAVLFEDSSNDRSGTTRYVSLPANAVTNVRFVTFCTNREKDTPKTHESFTRAGMPSGLQSISQRLSRYYADNFGRDVFSTIQLAVWRHQGETAAEIADVYYFTEDDWAASSGILGVADSPTIRASGTYSYSSDYTVILTDGNFSMTWGDLEYSGTYITIGNTLILWADWGDYTGTDIFTVNSVNAIQDEDGDTWRRR